jgi:hypothetical protein
MAETQGGASRSGAESAIIVVLVLAVVALLVWFIATRGADDTQDINVDINVPEAPAGS